MIIIINFISRFQKYKDTRNILALLSGIGKKFKCRRIIKMTFVNKFCLNR